MTSWQAPAGGAGQDSQTLLFLYGLQPSSHFSILHLHGGDVQSTLSQDPEGGGGRLQSHLIASCLQQIPLLLLQPGPPEHGQFSLVAIVNLFINAVS